MVRSRRRERSVRHADSSWSAREQAVRDAEAIVCAAWAEELLRQTDCTAIALDAARQECRVASERLVAAQHFGDLRRISQAHLMMEYALEVHRASEAASEGVRQELEAVLAALAREKALHPGGGAAGAGQRTGVRQRAYGLARPLSGGRRLAAEVLRLWAACSGALGACWRAAPRIRGNCDGLRWPGRIEP